MGEHATGAVRACSPPERAYQMVLDSLLNTFTAAPARSRPRRGLRSVHRETIVEASLDETFEFFSDAAQLQVLTPAWLNFRIVTPMPVVMHEGLELDYRITLYGFPLSWRSRIDVWEPGVRFVDRQVVGPYRWWRHEHLFEPHANGTRVVDAVEYVPRARWISSAFVRRDVERIFGYRQDALRRVFEARRRA